MPRRLSWNERLKQDSLNLFGETDRANAFVKEQEDYAISSAAEAWKRTDALAAAACAAAADRKAELRMKKAPPSEVLCAGCTNWVVPPVLVCDDCQRIRVQHQIDLGNAKKRDEAQAFVATLLEKPATTELHGGRGNPKLDEDLGTDKQGRPWRLWFNEGTKKYGLAYLHKDKTWHSEQFARSYPTREAAIQQFKDVWQSDSPATARSLKAIAERLDELEFLQALSVANVMTQPHVGHPLDVGAARSTVHIVGPLTSEQCQRLSPNWAPAVYAYLALSVAGDLRSVMLWARGNTIDEVRWLLQQNWVEYGKRSGRGDWFNKGKKDALSGLESNPPPAPVVDPTYQSHEACAYLIGYDQGIYETTKGDFPCCSTPLAPPSSSPAGSSPASWSQSDGADSSSTSVASAASTETSDDEDDLVIGISL